MRGIEKFILKNKFLYSVVKKPYNLFNKLKDPLLEIWIKKFGLFNGKERIKLLKGKKADSLMASLINSDKPLMIARYGRTEFYVLFNLGNVEREERNFCLVAGFFPYDKKLIDKFRKLYFESSTHLDVLATWLYKKNFFVKKRFIRSLPNVNNFIDIEDLNPINSNWYKELTGKRVLVVHPFKDSILYQYKRRKEIKIIPEFKSLKVLKAVQGMGKEKPPFKDWFGALESMKKEIYKRRNSFDIALIGCGAYGFPLAAYVKSLGKKGIHVGGALQLLFGIKGARWEKYYKFNFPKNWIYPRPKDIPSGIEEVEKLEGKCYWK